MTQNKSAKTCEIKKWSDISNKYDKPDLLLGNGFTLQFSRKFSYSSLFGEFLKNTNRKFKLIFEKFETTNFELIQKHLNYAVFVNEILDYGYDRIEEAINHLREGLIKTIEEIHPKKNEIDFIKLEKIAYQLSNFGNIFTTNYDLYLYHIVMKTIDIHNKTKSYKKYQDYFWGHEAPLGFTEFKDFQKYQFKHIYYLHGSLFIYTINGAPVKLVKGTEDELISRISEQIAKGNFPLFVSEGTSKEKLIQIRNNYYLNFCYKKLESSDNAIIVFGNNLGEFDHHILEAITSNKRDIIYSIYCQGRSDTNIAIETNSFIQRVEKLGGNKDKISFIDSSTLFDLS